jgi:ABC-type multidrug transport system ATPase subunit
LLSQDAAVFALDEATANVDRTTDAAIQSALRQVVTARRANGRKRTVLVIAHRIDTIMDCDSVVVLSRGEVAEIGAPRQLLAKPGGVFAGYVAAATAGGMACGIPALPDVNTTTNTNNNDDDDVTAAVADAQAEDTEAGDDRSTGSA